MTRNANAIIRRASCSEASQAHTSSRRTPQRFHPQQERERGRTLAADVDGRQHDLLTLPLGRRLFDLGRGVGHWLYIAQRATRPDVARILTVTPAACP